MRIPMLAALLLAALPNPARAQDCAALPFDPAALSPRADTFELRVNGRAFGTQTTALDAVDGGWRFRETTALPAGSQTTEVRFDRALRMQSVAQMGTMAGQEMHIVVTYAGGRAVGRAATPGPEGIRTIDVDAAVPACAVDDNVLTALIGALPWSPGARYTVPVFASGRGEIETYTLAAGAVEPVELPGGPVEAYAVEVETGGRPLVFHLDARAPHPLVRITMTGTPMEIVRTSALPH